ncbi:hypothetical protein SASPL_130616 [Salvia splendens]|uniref:Uncharacterized protein n=1 Tax=Salvia splendens TaxID=180675 RepID=A0A8X8X6C8_SALSN|nr:hypothetical protein SASPL_130616 [Salvia splendens]
MTLKIPLRQPNPELTATQPPPRSHTSGDFTPAAMTKRSGGSIGGIRAIKLGEEGDKSYDRWILPSSMACRVNVKRRSLFGAVNIPISCGSLSRHAEFLLSFFESATKRFPIHALLEDELNYHVFLLW